MEDGTKLSIYRAARSIKRKDNSLYNALRSIYEDSIFVGEISQLWPELPLVANLRCGLWYSPKFHSNCYFKSTDGHTNNLSFNTSRLNLHLAQLAGQKGGCMIVDSTRRGKRFPDSMSKTIPIWTCVLNRCIRNHLIKMNIAGSPCDSNEQARDSREASVVWDCSLHLPLWVSKIERAAIERRLEEWTEQLDRSGADFASLAGKLKKPLRPLWISQRSVIWLNEVPDHDSWDFTPIILVSASASTGFTQIRTTSEHSWNYIAGAGDDEESWARGLSPNLFWNHVYELVSAGPEFCNRRVADIVEKDRVYRARRGQNAPQIIVKSAKSTNSTNSSANEFDEESPFLSNISCTENESNCYTEDCAISWLGETNLAVCASQAASDLSNVDFVLNCDKESIDVVLPVADDACLHLPILTSKFDRFSLLTNLPAAIHFAKLALSKGKRLLICCHNGEDISICVCLAVLISLFDDKGTFDGGNLFRESHITKCEMRKGLVLICSFAANARPSRGNLKQVFSFLSGGRAHRDTKQDRSHSSDTIYPVTIR